MERLSNNALLNRHKEMDKNKGFGHSLGSIQMDNKREAVSGQPKIKTLTPNFSFVNP